MILHNRSRKLQNKINNGLPLAYVYERYNLELQRDVVGGVQLPQSRAASCRRPVVSIIKFPQNHSTIYYKIYVT